MGGGCDAARCEQGHAAHKRFNGLGVGSAFNDSQDWCITDAADGELPFATTGAMQTFKRKFDKVRLLHSLFLAFPASAGAACQ